MELSPTTKIGIDASREDRHRRGLGHSDGSGETDIPAWPPRRHDQQNSRKSPRTLDETTPKGYGPRHRRRARLPQQLPQPPSPSSPPLYPSLHFPNPPPPHPLPPPPPVITWHATFSEFHGKYYFCNLKSGETCWEHPKAKGARVVSRHPAEAHDADNKRGISPGKSRLTTIRSKSGKVQDVPIAASCRSRRGENTAAAEPAGDILRSQGAVLGNECGGNPHCETNPCHTRAKLVCRDNKANSDANTRQSACPESYRASFTRPASAVHMKRPYDPPVVVGGCSRRGDLRRQMSGGHVKRHARRNQHMCVKEAPLAASPQDGQTEPPRRRPLCQSTSKSSSVPRGAPSRRGSCIAEYLILAENWLAESKRERRTDCSSQNTSPLKAAALLGNSALSQSTTPVGDQVRSPRLEMRDTTTARLRGKAAAEWAAGEAQRRDEKQMTGTPEITRLGRSKRRSVDDLFLFKRNVDTARRQNQDDREIQENAFLTGRPELNSRSKLLAERRSRNRQGAHESASQRLHREALEQRQRQDSRRTRVEMAARRRANPELSASSKTVSRNRGDVARRLYDQALSGREGALERERVALAAPQGGTFRPVITQRSVHLARRRRRRKGWGLGGVEVSGRRGVIEETLLAEGVAYEQRRQKRQERQEQFDKVLRRGVVPSRHSKRLLLEIERRSNANGTQPILEQGGTSTESEEPVAGVGVDQTGFKPNLEALEASKKMLESRYGGSVPSMAQRAKERELKRIERRAQSVEQEKENDGFAAKTYIQQLGGSRVSGRCRRSVGVAGDVGGSSDIYERTTENNTRKEKRRAVELQARLEEEMIGCTFAPDLPARRGVRSRQTKSASNTASVVPSKEGRMGKDVTGADVSISASTRSSGAKTGVSRRQSDVNCTGGEAENPFQGGGDVWTDGGEPTANDRATTNGVDSWPLPDNWSAFVTPGGREYFFDARWDVVQWERPT